MEPFPLPINKFLVPDQHILQKFQSDLETLADWELQESIFEIAVDLLASYHADRVGFHPERMPSAPGSNHVLRTYSSLEHLWCDDLVNLSQAGKIQLQGWLGQQYLYRIGGGDG